MVKLESLSAYQDILKLLLASQENKAPIRLDVGLIRMSEEGDPDCTFGDDNYSVGAAGRAVTAEELLNMLEAIDWPSDMHTKFRPSNYVYKGLGWRMSKYIDLNGGRKEVPQISAWIDWDTGSYSESEPEPESESDA